MKTFVKLLSMILAIICVLSVISACTPAEPPEETPEDGSSSETNPPETTAPPKDPITITADYVVVRPEICSDAAQQAAVDITNALSDALGSRVSIKEDFLFGDMKPAELEILVGNTNREESQKVLGGIRYNDYSISIEGKKLVIAAYTDAQITEAANYLLDLIGKASGSLEIKDEDQKTVKAEYHLSDITFGGNSIKDYSIILPATPTNLMKTQANKLQQAICELAGYYLPVKLQSTAETEKEILIGDTNRAASEAVDSAALGEYGYAIKTDGTKLVVKSNDKTFAFMSAIKMVIDSASDGKIEDETGNYEVPKDPYFTTFTFTDVHNNFAMLEPTNSTGDYIVRKNVDAMIDHLLATEGPVDMVMVGGDLMSDYPYWNKSGNWPYKYFVEYRALLNKTFARLSKDGKVAFNGGNHDYGQGEGATDCPYTEKGNYNSTDFYFGEDGMRQSIGELPEEDMFWKVGTHTGDKYLICYYYKINDVHVLGLAPDPDIIWAKQGDGFSEESLKWMKNKLNEIDPYGTEVIFVNCHYPLHNTYENADGVCQYPSNCVSENGDGTLCIRRNNYNAQKLAPVFSGHSNLFHFFGHWESWYHDYSSRAVIHYNKSNVPVQMKGDERESTELLGAAGRGFTSVNMGHFRPMYNDSPKMFNLDHISGYGGYSNYAVQHGSTRTPKCGQGMYVKVYEDRIVFQMKNIGTYEGLTTNDILEPYTVWLYK